jgi:hypothetical protein
MGLLTDFFAATSDEVKTTDWNNPDDPLHTFPSVRMSQIDPVKIGTLEDILVGSQTTTLESVLTGSPPTWMSPLWEAPDGECWVFQLPESLSSLLAQLDANQIKVIAGKWCDTEELKLEGFTTDSAEWVIAKLASLAKEVQQTGNRLFVRLRL